MYIYHQINVCVCVCVCVCVSRSQVQPLPHRGDRVNGVNRLTGQWLRARGMHVIWSPGRRSMPSLTSPLARPPSEDLHTSRALVPSCARRVERKHSIWRLGTWTVRTLVDTEKSVETDRQGREVYCAEDRGIDLVVHELNRYDVKAAALQETLWFGSNVYHVGESLVLASCWHWQASTSSWRTHEERRGCGHSTFWASSYQRGEPQESGGSHGVLDSSLHISRQARGEMIIYTSSLPMHQPAAQLVEKQRTSSFRILIKFCLPFPRMNLMYSLGTSMHM